MSPSSNTSSDERPLVASPRLQHMMNSPPRHHMPNMSSPSLHPSTSGLSPAAAADSSVTSKLQPPDASSPADTAGTHESFPGAGAAHDSFAGTGGAGTDSRIPNVGASWPSQAFGSLQFQASQPQATASQAMVSSGLPTLGSGRDWQPPQDQLGRFIPPGLDSSSFIAGERSALLRAFRETLPSQQAIGSLYHAVHQITGRMDQEACDVRKVQTAMVEVAATLQATSARLDGLEHMRIPQVEERLTEAESGHQSQEFQATLRAMTDVLAVSGGHRFAGSWSHVLWRQLRWLLATCGGYAQHLLSKADVAAIFLSRKILLDDLLPVGQFTALPRPEGQGVLLLQQGQACALPLQPTSSRTVLGAMLFLGLVESLWQVHDRGIRLLPQQLRHATAPVQLGLKTTRAAVWAAAVTLTTLHARHSCYTIADRWITVFSEACSSKQPGGSNLLDCSGQSPDRQTQLTDHEYVDEC